MPKAQLTLYVDTDLKTLAKASGLNLSQEFEYWLKMRMNIKQEITENIDTDKEIAKHLAEIEKLKSVAEIQKEQDFKEQEENMVIDNLIEKMEETRTTITSKYPVVLSWDKFINHDLYGLDSMIKPLQFLFNKKFKKLLGYDESKELLIKRMKEKGILKVVEDDNDI